MDLYGSTDGKPEPPFSPPDCPWEPMSPGKPFPTTVYDFGGKLNGEQIYVGRAYDDGSYFPATVIPSKGICTYITKDLEIKTTDTYDVLTTVCGDPLEFRHMDFESHLLFVSGGDAETLYYCCRVKDGEDTYYGWGDKERKIVYIPRATDNKLHEGYDVLIHRFLDRLCICPVPPNVPLF